MPARVHDRDAERLEPGLGALGERAGDDGIGLGKADPAHVSSPVAERPKGAKLLARFREL